MLENLIKLNIIRDIQISILKKKEEGMIISEEIINEILFDIEAPIKEENDKVENLIDNEIKFIKENDF